MSISKLQIKAGSIEFSGEGNQDWLAKQLDKILAKVQEAAIEDDSGSSVKGSKGKGKISGLSLLNIAGKLGCKSGSELAVASAAFLHFVEGKPQFTREELLNTMKKATGFYKGSYRGNLTTILSQLEKNGTFNKSSNSYALHTDKVGELNGVLSK